MNPPNNCLIFSPLDGTMPEMIENYTADGFRKSFPDSAWLFNPWTGKRREPKDVFSDPLGMKLVAPVNLRQYTAGHVLNAHEAGKQEGYRELAEVIDKLLDGNFLSGATVLSFYKVSNTLIKVRRMVGCLKSHQAQVNNPPRTANEKTLTVSIQPPGSDQEVSEPATTPSRGFKGFRTPQAEDFKPQKGSKFLLSPPDRGTFWEEEGGYFVGELFSDDISKKLYVIAAPNTADMVLPWAVDAEIELLLCLVGREKDGRYNQEVLLNAQKVNPKLNNYPAARWCASYRGSSIHRDDWHLPTTDDLRLMWANASHLLNDRLRTYWSCMVSESARKAMYSILRPDSVSSDSTDFQMQLTVKPFRYVKALQEVQ